MGAGKLPEVSMTAKTPVPPLRAYDGPAVLSYGFRPCFLLGSIYAGLKDEQKTNDLIAYLKQFDADGKKK